MCKAFSLSEPELLYLRNKRKFCQWLSTKFTVEPHAEGSNRCAIFDHCITYCWMESLVLAMLVPCPNSTSPWALICHWELNKKVRLKYMLRHTRMEEQSLNINQLLKVYFFATVLSLVESRNRASFLKRLAWSMVIVMIWRNNKEFLMRGLLEPVSALHSYIFVTSLYNMCKLVLVALPLLKVPLKKYLPQPT